LTEPHERIGGMYTDLDDAAKTIQMLVEGCSVRSVSRLTDFHHRTILKLLVFAGERCEKVMGRLIRNVPVTDVQCDEIWGTSSRRKPTSCPARRTKTVLPMPIVSWLSSETTSWF
jgi:hypothetical protein